MAVKHFGKTKDRHIYLSTSNQAEPNDVRQIRRWLLEKGWTIIEHEGDVYNENKLYETSIMLMIGYDTEDIEDRPVGKGQYHQLHNRESYDYGSNWMLCDYDLQGTPVFRPVETGYILNDDQYKRGYGLLTVKQQGSMLTLQNYNKVGVNMKKKERSNLDTFGEETGWTADHYSPEWNKIPRKLRMIRAIRK